MAHRSRWGWYPCDYQTFQLLKKLNARCTRAQRDYAAWRRWQRKKPSNRVLREKIVDDQGCKVGSQVVGPRPEPPLDPLFCTRQKVVQYRGAGGQQLRESAAGERVSFADLGIPEAYGLARRPVPDESLVRPLNLTAEEVRRLAEQAVQSAGTGQ